MTGSATPPIPASPAGPGAFQSPFLHAPEGSHTVFLVTFVAACAPLTAGLVLFGWRAAIVAAVSMAGCVVTEALYCRLSRSPAMFGRSHAWLTGLLLGLTLPAWVPWYVPLVAAAFAILVGKALFGGVGHFLWQPALVGRLAVAVMFPALLHPPAQPVLAQDKLIRGDVLQARPMEPFTAWKGVNSPEGADALLVTPPAETLDGLTQADRPAFSAIGSVRDIPRRKPLAILRLVSLRDLILGGRPGGLGETCIAAILVAGLYLVYRAYVKWQLPAMFILSAAAVAAVCPVQLAGPNNTVETHWWPIAMEGWQVGITYVNYQLLTGGIFLAAFFLAT